MIELEIGDRVIKKSTGEAGFVHDTRKKRALMIEVHWETTNLCQWLPAEELRAPAASDPPPPTRITPWGRTTPSYLVTLRKQVRSTRRKPDPKRAQEKLAEKLLSLSGARKNRTKMKAAKMIAEFEDRMSPGKRKAEWFESLPDE